MTKSIVFLPIAAIAACTASQDATGTSVERLSFPNGNNQGFCASNPSPECDHGTPLAQKQLALTFDDGPGSQTLALSSWLKGQNIRATFFVLGEYATSSSVLAQLEADGHLVGNHTWDHPDLTQIGDARILSEVSDTDAVMSAYAAQSHLVFRAPYGAWSAHDYAVLQGSSMSKYVGPVRWDIGGEMTATYAADWDCWQATTGYGVMTTKQCGDRYLQQVTDVGRGIVLMHDQDYGDVSNHSLTSGKGNTIDMVKYIVPILKQRGYSFVRIDEIADIAAQWQTSACAFNPTWRQGSANAWWIEYSIGGSIASASLEVVGGATTPLSFQWGKWVGGPNNAIPSGTKVVVHATSTSNQTARTQPFPYLVTTSPVTDCGGSDAGAGDSGAADSGGDAGSADASDGGTCVVKLDPTWSQGNANQWWVEYAISANATIASAWLEAQGGQTVTLSYQWNKWVGGPNNAIPTGTNVIVHAQDTQGNLAQTKTFAYLVDKAPTTDTTCR